MKKIIKVLLYCIVGFILGIIIGDVVSGPFIEIYLEKKCFDKLEDNLISHKENQTLPMNPNEGFFYLQQINNKNTSIN